MKISLRPIQEKDLSSFFHLREKMRLRFEFFPDDLGSEYKFKKKFYETGFWEDSKGISLIIDSNEKIIGMLWYGGSSLGEGFDLGFCIFNEEDRAKGYMKEALSLFSSYLFAIKKINRLQLLIPDYHRAAMAVAQKCAYSFEGIARKSAFYKGKYVDLCIYSLLRSECKNIDRLL